MKSILSLYVTLYVVFAFIGIIGLTVSSGFGADKTLSYLKLFLIALGFVFCLISNNKDKAEKSTDSLVYLVLSIVCGAAVFTF